MILTLPFTINELGYGTNAKLRIGFQKHYWRELGYEGLVYADNGVMNLLFAGEHSGGADAGFMNGEAKTG